ncbi:MAG TPA: hypothetical protein VGN80_01385 [Devosiaceae bacterium]|jgi:hypothetical protein|nr:hypothetical protein [Devosiaceae bacterium]
MGTPDNTSRLRRDIDSGRTGDKVDFPDPAAAPLGTDAEAGGDTPEPASAATRPAPVAPPARQGMRRDQLGVIVYAAVAGVVAIAILAVVAWSA